MPVITEMRDGRRVAVTSLNRDVRNDTGVQPIPNPLLETDDQGKVVGVKPYKAEYLDRNLQDNGSGDERSPEEPTG